MRRKHDGQFIFAPYYERINDQYDIERVVLEFHIEVQKQPDFHRYCLGLFPCKNGNVTFKRCTFVPVPVMGKRVGRWRVSSGHCTSRPICWAYFDGRNFPDMFWEVMEGE